MYRLLFFSAVTACFLAAAGAASTCFYPDGVTTEPNHIPCNSTIGTSACCDPLDSCSSSGLCLGRTGFSYRGSCTDKTWTSSNCPSSCHTDPFDNAAYNTYTPLWSCDKPGAPSYNYCCNSPNRNCCTIATFSYGTTGFAFKGGMDQLLAEVAAANSSAQATVTVTAIGSGSQATGSSAAGVTAQVSSSTNIGSTIGAAIGVPLGLLAIGLIGFLFWREQKHGKAEAIARMRAIEMDPGNKPWVCAPGPPPKPPQSDQGTWSSQTATLTRNTTSASAQKSPAYTETPAGVHELI